MATSLRHVTVAPKGMGLNDFVAQQEGYFAAEALMDHGYPRAVFLVVGIATVAAIVTVITRAR